MTIKDMSQEYFHKICVVGGGITGAVMVLLLKNSNVFKSSDIGWINPNLKSKYDFRTTFYNETSLELLNNLNILKRLKKNDYTSVKKIKVFGIDNDKKILQATDNIVKIGKTEFKILSLLMSRPENVFSRDQIIDFVWNNMPDIDNRTVDVHVSRLRKVLNDNYHGTCKIHTVHGFGYCIRNN